MMKWTLSFVLLVSAVETMGALFEIDPARSQVTLSGSVAGSSIQQQGPGSLTTAVQGVLNVELTPASIQFLEGSLVDALTNGSWQPGVGGASGSAPADFGAQASSFIGTIRGALRDLVADVSSPVIPLSGSTFDAADMLFEIPESSDAQLDFNAGIAGSGGQQLASIATNSAATLGTISTSAGVQTLSIDVDATFYLSLFSANDTILNLEGQIVAAAGDAPAGPRFRSIDLVDGQVRLTVDGDDGSLQLQSSNDLNVWVDRQPQVTALDADTQLYVLPVSGEQEFYRLSEEI